MLLQALCSIGALENSISYYSLEMLNWVKIDNFLSHVTLEIDEWPWKAIRYLSYATSIFVHNFVTIYKFK